MKINSTQDVNLFFLLQEKCDRGIFITYIYNENMTLDTKCLTNLHFNLSIFCKLSIFLRFYNDCPALVYKL